MKQNPEKLGRDYFWCTKATGIRSHLAQSYIKPKCESPSYTSFVSQKYIQKNKQINK